jgi:hypothetical protein
MNNGSIKQSLLIQARKDIYSWSTNDLTCQLAKNVMSIGYTKIKLFLKEFGLDPNDVIVIFGPDGSVTRNKARFNEGVGYGCIVATKDYIFPSLLHPNGCGYGLYRLEDIPPTKELIRKLSILKKNGVPIGNQVGKWDVWKSNHFIDILKLDEIADDYLNQYDDWLTSGYYALIHSSQQTEKQKLSYWNAEEFMNFQTPFGQIEGLSGDSCSEYMRYFRKVESYSKEKRNSIANELFGEENVTCIANPTHQGYYREGNYFVMRLGLYDTNCKSGEKKIPLFPMGFNGYSFIYLYEGLSNIKKIHWTNNQFERAENKGHIDFLLTSNLLPHGGGYKLLYPYTAIRSFVFNSQIYFELYDAPMESKMLIQNIEALEYGYRGPGEVLPLVDRLELGSRVARFIPIQVIKF